MKNSTPLIQIIDSWFWNKRHTITSFNTRSMYFQIILKTKNPRLDCESLNTVSEFLDEQYERE